MDGTAEAVAEEVVQRDEAELARVVRGARDDDAAGVEEGPEPLEHMGVRRLRRRRTREPFTAGIEDHQRIDGDRQGAPHDQRVHVDTQHVGTLEPEADEVTLGLVDDRGPAELQYHGEAELLGSADRSYAIWNEGFAGNGDTVAGQQQLGIALGERGSRGREPRRLHDGPRSLRLLQG